MKFAWWNYRKLLFLQSPSGCFIDTRVCTCTHTHMFTCTQNHLHSKCLLHLFSKPFDNPCNELVIFHCMTDLRVSIAKPGLLSVTILVSSKLFYFYSFYKTWRTPNNLFHQWAIEVMDQLSNASGFILLMTTSTYFSFLDKILCGDYSTLLQHCWDKALMIMMTMLMIIQLYWKSCVKHSGGMCQLNLLVSLQ